METIQDQAYNISFHQNSDTIQYSAASAITGAVKETFREKLYKLLGFESLNKDVGIDNFVVYLK